MGHLRRMCTPIDAVVLAAGLGQRLAPVWDAGPKGLLHLGGESLMGRSVRLLRECGIQRIVIVVGHRREEYDSFVRGQQDLELVENAAFATTGSMASFARALTICGERPLLLLESDLVYERRALHSLLAHAAPSVVLGSGTTHATDEVWLDAPGGRLRAMSKNRSLLGAVHGELVGITKLSPTACTAMRLAFERWVRTRGHGQMAYETDALVEVAREHPIAVHIVDDLLWGEIDDAGQLERVRGRILPAILAREVP